MYLIHVRAHKENATSGGLEEIFLGERVGNLVRIEPGALVRDRDFEVGIGQFEADGDVLGWVFLLPCSTAFTAASRATMEISSVVSSSNRLRGSTLPLFVRPCGRSRSQSRVSWSRVFILTSPKMLSRPVSVCVSA